MRATKPRSDGTRIPPAMQQLFEKMCGGSEAGRATMCRGMMAPTAEAAWADVCAAPEVRTAFEAWVRRAEDQVLAVLRARGPLDLATLAGALEIDLERAFFLLGKLVREGKATIGSIRAAGGPAGGE